ncbi:arylsulfatase A-like enzyme [Wenyingzhuangia heitensis]|uniref:Arylsulfatase A-like enzyme n=1 Tax=Wenyingzhuangia heitensis TaxID=1487859 RepID=A0ABX0UCW0_9FLAO|nr:arylsulfatase [Wenyingzhuangia heitensis]NIJ44897.1 arylsulfatase A-like enzyme [Wenyingzhuangia heitensis]
MKKNVWIYTLFALFVLQINAQKKAPNVILILTDDLGIGDLGCQGNPWLKTPEIDAFYEKSVRMTDFHVSPLCTPTRGAIMTGQYPINNGTWATFKGRDGLAENTITMANVFKNNGYKTALFGKWHLGDNYPSRPTDLGFDEATHHLAGGVGELSDYWGNSYFDDVYYKNNKATQFKGYCTDVWFEETTKFIKKNKKKPFFVYLPTNAPHDPLIVAEKYAAPYKNLEGKEIISANLYGMIANIDENFGKFQRFLEKEDLVDNTILIFMSDNGTRYGYSKNGKFGYNKGFRGIKGDKEEGGHRVPFFIRWPNGKIQGGKDLNELAEHVDLMPTLAAMCNLKIPENMKLDGRDFSTILSNPKASLKNKIAFVHNNQDWRPPSDVAKSCIMHGKWRLINGKELYDIEVDPKQKNNVIEQHPELSKQLLYNNKQFVAKAKQKRAYQELPFHVVGNKAQKEIKLTIQHAIGEDGGIWKPEQVAVGLKNKNNTHAIYVEKAGVYEISCARWPKECLGPIVGIPSENPKDLYNYKSITPDKVSISIANQKHEKKIQKTDEMVTFTLKLEPGKTLLTTDFIEGKEKYGVYYTYVKYIKGL